MLCARCLASSTSSSTERWPVWEKKVSTIRSRCRVAFRPRDAIQLARRSRAAAAEAGLRGTARLILKLSLSLEKDSPHRPPDRQALCPVRSSQPAALAGQLAPGVGLPAHVGPRQADQ